METLAYLHVALTHDNPASTKMVSSLHQEAVLPIGLKWERFSSWAWRYMLPIALNLAILSVASNVLALGRGDQGPAVTTLQAQLKASGFFNSSPTDIYGPMTEDAVRRFQAAHNLSVDGIAGPETLQKLEGYRRLGETPNSPNRENTLSGDRTGDILKRGDSSEAVRILQEQLSAARLFNANPTGTFGPVTEDAVRRFQAAKHLVADGIVGPATRRELEKFGTGGEAPPIDASRKATLRRGDNGADVRVLQEQLKTAGFFSGSATGKFDLATEGAVRRFQSAHYLEASGIAGPTTRSALNIISHNGSHSGNAAVVPHLTNPDRDTLHLGDRGNDVRVLQEQLRAAGFFNADPTGNFGSITEDSVRRFQADNFLEASGIAGPTTRRKLQLGRPGIISQSKPQGPPTPVTPSKPQPSHSLATSQPSVVELQQRLQNLGFYDGPVNGIFDAHTKSAVRGAQRYYGVSEGAIQSGRF